ncbi:Hif prolyl hydroxylase [Favolaschia claudopus]|uniref:Hif prolyl hydroxylase n=1 Tax=Favolaschia claudopus TaxID=2862362 RepID=A0AAW0AL06_9AGAR
MAGTASFRRCAVCDRQTALWCSRCHEVWYCSPEHNIQVCTTVPFLQHSEPFPRPGLSIACSSLETIAEESLRSVQAIFFPVNEDYPRMIAIELRDCGRACPVPVLEPHCKGTANSVVLQRALNKDLLRYPLHLFCDSERHVNRAVQRITSGLAKPFLGNAVVLKYNGTRRADYTNATEHDLPTLSAYFLHCQ